MVSTMRQETEKPRQPERDILTPEGFVRLEKYDRILPEEIWSQPDEIFVRWAEAYTRVSLPIVTFEIGTKDGGLKGKLLTRSLGKFGVPAKVADGLGLKLHELEQYKPYVVEIQNPEEQKRLYELTVHREPDFDDYLRYKENGHESNYKPDIRQIYLFADNAGEKIGRLTSDKPVGKVVLIPRWLPDEVRNQVNDGGEWIGEVIEKDRYYFLIPHIKAEDWTCMRVLVEDGKPVVEQVKLHGIRERFISERVSPTMPEDISELLTELPGEQQAILARFWNIYWERHKVFHQEILQAQQEAWQAYKEERVHFREANSMRMVDMKDNIHVWQPVVIEGEDGGEFNVSINDPQPAVEAWKRYDDMRAVTTAEAYLIATRDDHFVSYLREEEGLELGIQQFERALPSNEKIYVGNLGAIVINHRGKDDRNIARETFRNKDMYEVETKEIDNDVVRMQLHFAPTLYMRDPTERERAEDVGLIGKGGKVFEVGYSLMRGDVEYRDCFYDLPEHIRDRIADILATHLVRLRESSLVSPDGKVVKVSWKRIPTEAKVEASVQN